MQAKAASLLELHELMILCRLVAISSNQQYNVNIKYQRLPRAITVHSVSKRLKVYLAFRRFFHVLNQSIFQCYKAAEEVSSAAFLYKSPSYLRRGNPVQRCALRCADHIEIKIKRSDPLGHQQLLCVRKI